ncbi:hypothetical protein ZHAS_00021140 [Anopheles sinensis]|uniref:Uncharacterized protein n=1 Tax=Anopheles sinensis TaxID=74873 RepID=A0A084WRM3_ANOSI|nr:hypothetical protein ZHAS_00021140 [Anopheles sinensis]
MEDFGSSGFIIENSYKYRTKNVLSATSGASSGAAAGSSPANGHGGKSHHHQLNNSAVNGTNNLGGGGSNSRVVSPNQSTSSAPNNAHGKQRALRHYTNNFGSNLNGGHSYDAGQQHPTVPTHGKKLVSLKNHRSVDNLLDNVDINYSQYYQEEKEFLRGPPFRSVSDVTGLRK